MKNVERVLPPILKLSKKFKGWANFVFASVVLVVIWVASFWLFNYGAVYRWTILPAIVTALGILTRVTIWWLFKDNNAVGETNEQ